MASLKYPSEAPLRAKTALQDFHNASLGYSPNYNLNFDGFLKYVDKEWPNFRAIFGAQLITLELDRNQEKILMESLAKISKGALPTRSGLAKFIDAPVTKVNSFSYRIVTQVEDVKQAVVKSAKEITAYAGMGVVLYALGAATLLLILRKK